MPVLSQTVQPKLWTQRYLLAALVASIAGLLVYSDAVARVVHVVLNREGSSHGVFVPFLTGYFIYTVKDRLQDAPVRFCWYGLPLMIAFLVVAWTGLGGYRLQFVVFVCFVFGSVLTLLGPAVARILAFPLLFLITMTPWPQGLYEKLANLSRTIAFGGSLQVISWLGIPHVRNGWDIELPNALLQVAISCSGIRYLVSFVVFGLAYAFLFRSSTTGRVLTVLATIPISLFASICRLTIIFVMTHYISPFWSQHKPHVVLSWFVFFSVLFTCILVDQWVGERRGKGDRR